MGSEEDSRKNEGVDYRFIYDVVIIFLVLCVGLFIIYKSFIKREIVGGVVESSSMQHSKNIDLENINTGDIVLFENKEYEEISSYFEGWEKKYKKYGEYGDVIAYNAGGKIILHRAFLKMKWVEEEGKWKIESLDKYPYKEFITESKVKISEIGYGKKNIVIDLKEVPKGEGIITLGDNAEGNKKIDLGYITKKLLKEEIVGAAWFKIPFVGSIKLILFGKYFNNEHVKKWTALLGAFWFLLLNGMVIFIVYGVPEIAERIKDKIKDKYKREDIII